MNHFTKTVEDWVKSVNILNRISQLLFIGMTLWVDWDISGQRSPVQNPWIFCYKTEVLRTQQSESTRRKYDQTFYVSGSPSRCELFHHQRVQHQRKRLELQARDWIIWLQQRKWSSEWMEQQAWKWGIRI